MNSCSLHLRSDRDAARQIFEKEKLPFFEVFLLVLHVFHTHTHTHSTQHTAHRYLEHIPGLLPRSKEVVVVFVAVVVVFVAVAVIVVFVAVIVVFVAVKVVFVAVKVVFVGYLPCVARD